MGYADRFVDYDPIFNNLIIWGDLITLDDNGSWPLTMTVEYVDTRDKSRTYSKIIQLDVQIEGTTASQKFEKYQETTYSSISEQDLDGIFVMKTPQKEQDNRPVPYIADFTSRGVLKIAWNQQMKPFTEPKEIPTSRIAVDYELYDDDASPSQDRRNLRQGSREIVWVKELEERESRKFMLLDALEVKMVKDAETSETSDLKSF